MKRVLYTTSTCARQDIRLAWRYYPVTRRSSRYIGCNVLGSLSSRTTASAFPAVEPPGP